MAEWMCVLELDAERRIVAGSEESLCDAIRRGADLRIYTEFIHNEHIDVTSDNPERVCEVAEFAVTYLVEDSWAAGIMSLRQPIELPVGFGPRPSMSFFLYNQNGQQGIARPYLDGNFPGGAPGPSAPDAPADMPKYHVQSSWDAQTNAPCRNFMYDFDVFRYCICDRWREVFAHDATGAACSGSLEGLVEAFLSGCELKVGVRGICDELTDSPAERLDHELLVQAGPGYYYTEAKMFMVGSHPMVRVKPGRPLLYASQGWDFGWLMLRTDGRVVYRRCDPYTLMFKDVQLQCAVRWFVR